MLHEWSHDDCDPWFPSTIAVFLLYLRQDSREKSSQVFDHSSVKAFQLTKRRQVEAYRCVHGRTAVNGFYFLQWQGGLWDTLALNVNGTVNGVGKRTTFKLLACRTSKSLPLQPACSDTYRMCRLRSFQSATGRFVWSACDLMAF